MSFCKNRDSVRRLKRRLRQDGWTKFFLWTHVDGYYVAPISREMK